LINNAWGGSMIEPWISPDAWDRIEELRALGTNVAVRGQIYNGRVAPLAPYGIKGAIWYQGESNGLEGDIYYHKMRALISCWRHAWCEYAAGEQGAQGEDEYQFPFYYVQLCNCKRPSTSPGGGGKWTRLRMAQLKALSIPRTGMAVTIDVGSRIIHPGNKQDVGTRLALWALAKDYGQTDLVYSGPLYKGMKVESGKIRISFDHVGSGLMIGHKEGYGPAKDATTLPAKAEGEQPELNSFGIAGADKQWFAADAVIEGPTVLVSSTNVPSPVAVRYAFNTYPLGCNLYNREGLPASPFRTDDW